MLAETPDTQRSHCYTAVSSSLINPLPGSNYSPFYHTPTLPHSRINKPLCWRLILHCCTALLQNLVGNSGETQCLEEIEQQAEEGVNVDVPLPPLQIVISVLFCLYSLYLYPLSAPFLNPLSSHFPHFP